MLLPAREAVNHRTAFARAVMSMTLLMTSREQSMSVTTAQRALEIYKDARALGDKEVSSDFMAVFADYPQTAMLIDKCPQPWLAPFDAIEVPNPLGTSMWQAGQLKVNGEGTISLMETVVGHVQDVLFDMLTTGKQCRTDVIIYAGGSTTAYRRKWTLRDCIFIPEVTDRDWSAREELLRVNGSLKWHYFGEYEVGPLQGLGNGVGGLTGYEPNA